MNKGRGFTILELLIVIAIIGLLAAIVLAATGESRAKGRNADVISQIREYQKALELYYADNGNFPSGHSGAPFSRGRLHCIGDEYTSGQCVPISQNSNYASQVESALVPTYISKIRHISQGQYSSPAYNGCSRLCANGNCGPAGTPPGYSPAGTTNVSNANNYPLCTDQNYSLFYVLEGIGEDCGPGEQILADSNGYTLCQLRESR